MNQIAELCKSIAATINDSGHWSGVFRAEQKWTVTIRAEEVGTLTVTIVPESESKTRLTRASAHTLNSSVVSLIVQERIDNTGRVDELACMVDDIDRLLREQSDFDSSGMKWRYQSSEKVFIREHLEQFGVFTCGMAITFITTGAA